jgi:exosortase C (VPDSG-CTERM-specific)
MRERLPLSMTTEGPPLKLAQAVRRKSLPARCSEWWQSLDPLQRSRLKGACIFWVILTLAFLKPLISLMVYAVGMELHSHVVLVPLVSAYLILIDRERLPLEFDTSRGWSLSFMAAGLSLLSVSFYLQTAGSGLSTNDRHILPVLSFLFLFAAGGFFFLGRRWMTAAVFPLVFLLFMAPLPDAVADFLEGASRLASAEVTSWYFRLAGIPFLRDGTVFQLPGTTIQVAQECSGIRSSWVLFITSLIAAHMFLQTGWRKVIFVALVIPLGILRNGFRILVISWLCVEVGPEMIHHWIHQRGGPLFFALSLIPLFVVLWWLRRSEKKGNFKFEAANATKIPNSDLPPPAR